jgi:phage terminase large subunit
VKQVVKKFSLKGLFARVYDTAWKTDKRFVLIRGSRASGKSWFMGYKIILQLVTHPLSNVIVLRDVYESNRNSTHKLLIASIKRLGLESLFTWSDSETGTLTIVRKGTRQKIFFCGMNNPESLTSFAVETGFLDTMWVEEAFEVDKWEPLEKVIMNMRGIMPAGYKVQVYMTFTPWNEDTWLKSLFWDRCELKIDKNGKEYGENEDTYCITTNYLDNPWLSEDDKSYYEAMRERDPVYYRVAGLGEWGVIGGELCFPNLIIEDIKPSKMLELRTNTRIRWGFGVDFGVTDDPSCLVAIALDEDDKKIYFYDEIYGRGLSVEGLSDLIRSKGYAKQEMWCDGAIFRLAIQQLVKNGVSRAKPVKKARRKLDQLIAMREYTIIIDNKCKNGVREMTNYRFDEKGLPMDKNDHIPDAIRYAMSGIESRATFKFMDNSVNSKQVITVAG